MPRRSRSTGVGRGNGPGSAATQQKPGMPSLNPRGRPKKRKLPPPATMEEIIARELTKHVSGMENGIPFSRPLAEVMVASLMAEFQDATPYTKMIMLKWIVEMAPNLRANEDPHANDNAVMKLVNRLAEEYRREHPEDTKFGT